MKNTILGLLALAAAVFLSALTLALGWSVGTFLGGMLWSL